MSDIRLRWQERREALERRMEDHWRIIKDDQRRQDELERLILMWGDRVIALEAKAALAAAPFVACGFCGTVIRGGPEAEAHYEKFHHDAPEEEGDSLRHPTRTEEKVDDPALEPDTRLCHPWTCPIHRVKFWVPDGNEGFACPICDSPSPPASAEPGERFVCPSCGPYVAVQDDGCCVHCGRDTSIESVPPVPPQPSAEERGWLHYTGGGSWHKCSTWPKRCALSPYRHAEVTFYGDEHLYDQPSAEERPAVERARWWELHKPYDKRDDQPIPYGEPVTPQAALEDAQERALENKSASEADARTANAQGRRWTLHVWTYYNGTDPATSGGHIVDDDDCHCFKRQPPNVTVKAEAIEVVEATQADAEIHNLKLANSENLRLAKEAQARADAGRAALAQLKAALRDVANVESKCDKCDEHEGCARLAIAREVLTVLGELPIDSFKWSEAERSRILAALAASGATETKEKDNG